MSNGETTSMCGVCYMASATFQPGCKTRTPSSETTARLPASQSSQSVEAPSHCCLVPVVLIGHVARSCGRQPWRRIGLRSQLLALRSWESFPLMDIAPWRKGGDDHRRAVRSVDAHWINRTSPARRLRPEVRSIHHASARSGSALAVLRRVASTGEISVGGRRRVSELQIHQTAGHGALELWHECC